MNKNLQKLLDLIKQNPDLKVVPMVAGEICCDDSCCHWVGSFGSCEVTKMYVDNERVYLEDDVEELIEEYIDANYDSPFYDSPLSDEELEKEALESVKNYKWEKVIVVYIDLP